MPKVDAFKKHPFTARAFNYNVITDSAGKNSNEYYFYKDVELDVTLSTFGRIVVLFPDDAFGIMPEANLEQLKDKNGNEIYPGGVWTLAGVTPIISTFGVRDGFRANATLTFVTQ